MEVEDERRQDAEQREKERRERASQSAGGSRANLLSGIGTRKVHVSRTQIFLPRRGCPLPGAPGRARQPAFTPRPRRPRARRMTSVSLAPGSKQELDCTALLLRWDSEPRSLAHTHAPLALLLALLHPPPPPVLSLSLPPFPFLHVSFSCSISSTCLCAREFLGRRGGGGAIASAAFSLVAARLPRVEIGTWCGGEDLRVRSTEMAADDSEC